MEYINYYESDTEYESESESGSDSDMSVEIECEPFIFKNKIIKLNSLYIETIISMDELKKHIKKMRPKLSESSVTTYSGILKNLYKNVFNVNHRSLSDDFHFERLLKESDKVMEYLADVKYNVRKTILSALVAISEGDLQNKFRTLMLEDAQKYNMIQKKNVMTDAQRANWISWTEVEGHLALLKKKYYYIFKENKPTMDDVLNLQKYIILSCYVLIPPRRSQDFCLMKVRDFSEDKDNIFDKGKFTFRTYKTAKFLGVQVEKVPKSLDMLLRKWVAFTAGKSDFLFFNFYGLPLAQSALTKVLNSIFGKNISVNQLRHIYITEKSGPLIAQLAEQAKDMGHSTDQQKLYVKKE